MIRHRGHWRTIDAVEFATAEWIDWYNHRRLHDYCGDIPLAELETAYYAQHEPSNPPGSPFERDCLRTCRGIRAE